MITIIMYLIWILTIVALLAATFTGYQYIDLNIIALGLLAAALLNSFFVVTRKR